MKNYFRIFSIIFLIIFSCKKKVDNPLEVKCEKSKEQAQEDFKAGKFSWTNFSGIDFNFGAGNKEFAELLNKKNIKYNVVGVSCVKFDDKEFQNCYEITMNNLLENKFGKKYFDSLKIEGKKQFYLKQKDSLDKINH